LHDVLLQGAGFFDQSFLAGVGAGSGIRFGGFFAEPAELDVEDQLADFAAVW
jgi:hypothetical protein